jgi:hypothetical protein
MSAEFLQNGAFPVEFVRPKEIRVDFDAGSPIANKILYNTTAGWNAKRDLMSKRGYVYLYSDWKKDGEGKNICGIKVGDGTSFVIDLPFTDSVWADHVDDAVRHITELEREFWNNKVRCYINPNNTNELVFTTN